MKITVKKVTDEEKNAVLSRIEVRSEFSIQRIECPRCGKRLGISVWPDGEFGTRMNYGFPALKRDRMPNEDISSSTECVYPLCGMFLTGWVT